MDGLNEDLPAGLLERPDVHSTITAADRSAAAPARGQWLTAEQLPEWDALVQRHPLGTVFHTSFWKDAMEEALGHVRGRFYGLFDPATGALRGGLPLCTVRSWLLGTRVILMPFSTLIHPLLGAPEDLESVRAIAGQLKREASAREVTIKVRGPLPGIEQAGFRPTRSTWHHYLPLTDKPEKLKKNFSRSNVRQWIQRAERAGLTVERAEGEKGVDIFYPLFVHTRRRLGLPWVSREFFVTLGRRVGPRVMSIFVARDRGLPVAAVHTLQFKDILSLEALGESEAARKSGAVQLIYWTAIQTAYREGQRVVSFGQTEKDNEGLAHHKRGWGCVEETLTEYQYTPDAQNGSFNRFHGASKRRMRPVIRKLPVCLGTILSKFMYRHLA
ncbi:MAG TPA: GNAT family N-acetyltransferase [Verrucomicrobiae bacterium]|nr:GNAT family N-acetyltransferase [Verrucomicrobiae bacterium]